MPMSDLVDSSRQYWVSGPFVMGLLGTADNATPLGWSAESAGPVTPAAGSIWKNLFSLADFTGSAPEHWWSQGYNTGRIELYLRGDAADTSLAPAGYYEYNGTAFLMGFWVSYGTNGSQAYGGVRASDRKLVVIVDDGTTTLTVVSGLALPSDSEWHRLGFAWSVTSKMGWVYLDGTETTGTDAALSTAGLPADASVDDSEDVVGIYGWLPVAELKAYAGATDANPDTSGWDHDYYATWEAGATIHPSQHEMVGFFEPAPREAYELLLSLAEVEGAQIGIDENDKLKILPRGYFTLADQQAVAAAVNTDANTKTLNPTRDYTKIRNVVAIEFKTATLGTAISGYPLYELYSAAAIPPGTSYLYVQFQIPLAAELVDAPNTNIHMLTSAEAVAGTPSNPWVGFASVNTAADGTGIYATADEVKVRLVSYDTGSATVQFINSTSATYYLAHDGSQTLPYLRLMAYSPLVTEQQVVVATHPDSIARYGSRLLEVDLTGAGVLFREQVKRYAEAILGDVAYPTTILDGVEAFADPRRQPGDLVSVSDPDDTGISMNFRILRVQHRAKGADYQQVLRLREDAQPVGVWDETNWDHCVWGEEAL